MNRWLLAIWLGLAALPAWAFNQTDTRLLLTDRTARPGDTVWAGLEMTMPAPWHTYWRNGGDAGSPTTISWQLPKGVTAGDIQWPVPDKMVDKVSDETTLVTYVYSNKVVLLVPLKIAADAAAGPLEIKGTAHWQECADICVMASSDVSASLTVGSQEEPSGDAAEIQAWRKKVPVPAGAAAATFSWNGSPHKDGTRPLLIDWQTNVAPADFYPFANDNFDVQGLTESVPAARGVRLQKMVKKSDNAAWPARVAGLLVGKVGSAAQFAVEVEAPIQNQATAPAGASSGAVATSSGLPPSFLLMLGFALLGGLILNIMPCVLPVIALKVLGFVNQAKEHPRRVRQLGLVYGLGVLVSFLVLAGFAIGVQKAGGIANWGDAIRNPQFQVIITVLIALVTLNLFGVFEVTLGTRAMGTATGLASRHGLAGAFFNGVLATILATPCTAPFLGAALAFALTQSPVVTIAIFLTVGFGLALPFVAVCLWPGLLKFLPKPGPWMVRFKTAMGFPMLGTVIWLVWVSAREDEDFLWLGLFLVVLAAAAWVWGEFVQRAVARRGLAAGIAVALVACGYVGILEGELQWRRPLGTAKAGINWQTWSEAAVEEARREGHPVLVDFTARSCLNCLRNKARAIEIPETRAQLKKINAVAFEADFTHEDPTIARELRKFDHAGVPLVLVYSKDLAKAPEELPSILTPSIVRQALIRAAN